MSKVFILIFGEVVNDYWAVATIVEVFKERSSAEARRAEIMKDAETKGYTLVESDFQIEEREVQAPKIEKKEYPGMSTAILQDGIPVMWDPEPGCYGCAGCSQFDICTQKGGA